MIGSPTMAPYIASKHAVNGLVKTAAWELGAFKIRVNAIAPGPIDNRMMRSLENQFSPDVASDESSYCSGSIHLIDGGWTAV